MEALTAQLQSSLQAQDFSQLAPICDAAELQEPSGSFPPQWPFALHLLAHLYSSNLEDARFLYKRIPEEVKQSNAELQRCFDVLQRLWVKDYENLWKALDLEWSPQLQPLVKALSSKLRGDMLGLVMRAYSNLSPGKLGVLLGLPEQEAMQLAREQGWELDEASGLLLVKSRPAASQAHASQQQLQRLAEFVVHLEA